MASTRDYYEVLGVGREASAQEIKSAYRRVALRYHPDRNPGDAEAEEHFKEAAEAYSVLSDSDKRARYDRFGHQGVSGAGGFSGFDPTVFGDFADILGDFFGLGDLFGGRARGRPRGEAGADLRYDLSLSFEEAAFGTEMNLKIPRLESCPTCGGSGSASGERKPCSACGGRGQVRFTQGFFTVARTCPQCRGTGSVISDPCKECKGEGRVEKERSLHVRIPAGVDTGARLRLGGEGEHGRMGGPTGDLFVVIRVEPHERFERHDFNVISREEIGFAQAVLGAKLEVETLHGSKDLEIPPGSKHGDLFRLHGEGIERLGSGGRGDHIVSIEITVPKLRDLGPQEIEALRHWAELRNEPLHEGRGVLDRVKDFFA
ncbi:MAG TPA: molecular chaperone DnaJ [Thermoanaerobaculia bacterium]|nr:molecular chaperone DnaJ [Thermoanaerobaculia bacterium]